MEPEEYDTIIEEHHSQNPRRDIIERIVWFSNDGVRNHAEILINNIDHRLQQAISNENDVIQNGRSGEMQEFISSNLTRSLVTASYYQSEIRRYNFWTPRIPDENSDHIVPGIEVNTYLTPPSSLDQVVLCSTNHARVPIRVTGLTRTRENGYNRNVLSRQDSYIDQTNVNLSVDCQERKPKSKGIKYIKVCQNHKDCISRRVNERACRFNSCREITDLENSSSTGQLTSSATQGFQCQNACSSTSLVIVPKTGELEMRLLQNHEAKLPVPSTSMQTCNKERSANSQEQNNPNASSVNSEVPSNSTGMSSSTTTYNTYSESDSNIQSPFPTFSSFNNRNVTIEHNYSKPQVSQFSQRSVTLKEMVHDYPHSETSNEELMNDNPISDTNFPIVQPGGSAKSMEINTCYSHENTLSNHLQSFNRNNELFSNKPMNLISRKMTEMEANNKESFSKNIQKEGENSLNPLLLNDVNSDMQRAEPILMETCSRHDNNGEYEDTSASLKSNTEVSTTSVSYINRSKDSTPNSRLVEMNRDPEMAETLQKAQIENSHPSDFASDSMNSAVSNDKTASLKASIEKSETFCDKVDKLTKTKVNSDEHNISENLIGDSDEQGKENIPPDNSLPN